MKRLNLDEILKHYLAAALWTNELDEHSFEDFTEDSKKEAMALIVKFTNEGHKELEGWPEEQIGHDLWLTRGGHGAGFWDRTEYNNGDALTAICSNYMFHGEVFELGGKIHIEGENFLSSL
jgi:hypothetical protein